MAIKVIARVDGKQKTKNYAGLTESAIAFAQAAVGETPEVAEPPRSTEDNTNWARTSLEGNYVWAVGIDIVSLFPALTEADEPNEEDDKEEEPAERMTEYKGATVFPYREDGSVEVMLTDMRSSERVFWSGSKNSYVLASNMGDSEPNLHSVNGQGEIRWTVEDHDMKMIRQQLGEGLVLGGDRAGMADAMKYFGILDPTVEEPQEEEGAPGQTIWTKTDEQLAADEVAGLPELLQKANDQLGTVEENEEAEKAADKVNEEEKLMDEQKAARVRSAAAKIKEAAAKGKNKNKHQHA